MRLRSLGAEIEPFEPPIDYDTMAEANGFVFSAEGYTHHGKMMEDPDAPVDEDVRPRVLQGRNIAAHEYIRAMLNRKEHIALFLERLQGLAAIITPTIRTAAIPISEADQKSTPAFLTRPFNYLAMSALSVPMGLTPDGLPGGLQIVARGGDETMALRIGAAFERVLGGIGHPEL